MKKILICDAKQDVRESLNLILRDAYDTMGVDTSQQCLHTLEYDHQNIGCLLIDSTIDAVDQVLQVKSKKPSIPVLLVTGYRSSDNASKASQCKAAGSIAKPFQAKEILATVKKIYKA